MAGEAGRRLSGQRDLGRLLAAMQPRLHDAPYAIRLLASGEAPAANAFATRWRRS